MQSDELIKALPQELCAAAQALIGRLCSYDSLALAYSGGIDSTLLAFLAARLLPSRFLAVYFATPLAPLGETEAALRLAEELQIPLLTQQSDPLAIAQVKNNAKERCYYCKKYLFYQLRDLADERGLAVIADGSNLDDTLAFRPGRRALEELGVVSPLAQCGIDKKTLRALAEAWGLSNYDLPSTPCLATRFPYGSLLTEEGLSQVAKGELLLRQAGFYPCRLRHHGDWARICLPKEQLAAFCADVPKGLDKLGFKYLTLDLDGLKSGDFDK